MAFDAVTIIGKCESNSVFRVTVPVCCITMRRGVHFADARLVGTRVVLDHNAEDTSCDNLHYQVLKYCYSLRKAEHREKNSGQNHKTGFFIGQLFLQQSVLDVVLKLYLCTHAKCSRCKVMRIQGSVVQQTWFNIETQPHVKSSLNAFKTFILSNLERAHP